MKPYPYSDQLDFEISAEALARIDAALDVIEENTPFLIALSSKKRMVLRGLGIDGETFVTEVVNLGAMNPDLLPRAIDLARIERDRKAREELSVRYIRLQVLNTKFNDTILLLGSDYFNAALAIYACLKRFGGLANIGWRLKELGVRFKRPSRSKAKGPEGEQ